MSKLPISVCIIAKNEESRIEQCLSSVKPCGFEIVVVDTGSTDRTKEIAGKYADIVYLGVGLHSGYGSAQRMYVKRGYVPDGKPPTTGSS